MYIKDYLQTPKGHEEFSETRKKRLAAEGYRCSAHDVDLCVAEGYRIVGWDLMFVHCKTWNENPNGLWMYEKLKKPRLSSERAMVVFCPVCEKRRVEYESKPKA